MAEGREKPEIEDDEVVDVENQFERVRGVEVSAG